MTHPYILSISKTPPLPGFSPRRLAAGPDLPVPGHALHDLLHHVGRVPGEVGHLIKCVGQELADHLMCYLTCQLHVDRVPGEALEFWGNSLQIN